MRERGVTEEGGAVDRGAMGRVGEGGGWWNAPRFASSVTAGGGDVQEDTLHYLFSDTSVLKGNKTKGMCGEEGRIKRGKNHLGRLCLDKIMGKLGNCTACVVLPMR